MRIGDLVRLKKVYINPTLMFDDSLWLVLSDIINSGKCIKVQKIKTGYTTSLNKGAFEVVNANR